MNKKLGFFSAVAFSLVLSQTAFADTAAATANSSAEQQSCGCGGGERLKHLVDTLKLDDAQQAKIRAIKEQAKANAKDTWARIKELRSQINQLVQSDNVDQAKLDSLVSERKELFASMLKEKIMVKHQVYTVLNAEQKTQYQQMIQQWEANDMEHHRC